MKLDFFGKGSRIQVSRPLQLGRSLIGVELLSTSVVMRMPVIKSLFGFLGKHKDLVALLKIISLVLKTKDSFGVEILQLGWFIKLWWNGYGGLIIEFKYQFFF
jgi:hypothetical protein